jgi:hypothetical protein
MGAFVVFTAILNLLPQDKSAEISCGTMKALDRRAGQPSNNLAHI